MLVCTLYPVATVTASHAQHSEHGTQLVP
eukprot:COSAG05_NODE_13333_length_434_cov_0.767164_2_plen_28_part_01